MSLDARSNFAKVGVSTGYDNAAVTIALSSGDGALLPNPSVNGAFNLVWYNFTDYPDPTDDPNKEIVRCTARSTDTLTITRAQEGTSATTKNTAGKTYKMILSVTKKMIDDIEGALGASAWVMDYTPLQTVDGANAVFTLPNGVTASKVIVYADGSRALAGGKDYTFSGNNTITFVTKRQPYTSLSVDYLPS